MCSWARCFSSDYSEYFCESNVLGVQCHTVRVRQRAPQGEDGATRPAVEARTKLEQIQFGLGAAILGICLRRAAILGRCLRDDRCLILG